MISKNKVVSIHYALTDEGGNVIDSSKGREPFAFIYGSGMIVAGLEEALSSKLIGSKLQVKVPAEKGYGPRDESLVQVISRDQFPPEAEVREGDQFQAQHGHHMQVVTVMKISGTEITIDANHPLAGVTLNFDVEVIDVRDATSEELSHGHVHGPGGHHH